MLHKSRLPTSDPTSEPACDVAFPSDDPAEVAAWASCHLPDPDQPAVALGVGNVAFGVGDVLVLDDVLELVDSPPLLTRAKWTHHERVRSMSWLRHRTSKITQSPSRSASHPPWICVAIHSSMQSGIRARCLEKGAGTVKRQNSISEPMRLYTYLQSATCFSAIAAIPCHLISPLPGACSVIMPNVRM